MPAQAKMGRPIGTNQLAEIGQNGRNWPKFGRKAAELAEIGSTSIFLQFLLKITILCKVGIYEATYNNIILITAWL